MGEPRKRTRPRARLVAVVLIAALTALVAAPRPAGGATAPRPITFAPATYYPAGWFHSASLDDNGTATADLDGDGKQDVIMVAPWLGSRVDVMWGRGDGTFQTPAQQLVVGVLNSNVILGDFDRNGRTDLAVTGSTTFTVVLNDGGRRFHTGASYLLQQSPFQNTGSAVDADGDGLLDLVLKTPVGIQTMKGNGNGTFRYGPFSYVPGVPGALTSIDDANLDGDRFRDLVASDGGTQQVFSLLNRGDGSFTVKSHVSAPIVPATVRAADVNHRGLDSVVVLSEVSSPDHSVAVALNDGSGGLLAPRTYGGGFANAAGDVGDLNADGNIDIVSIDTFTGRTYLLAGVGDGTFVAAGSVGTAVNAQLPGLADLNRDGRVDLAVPVNCPGPTGLLGEVCLAVLVNRS